MFVQVWYPAAQKKIKNENRDVEQRAVSETQSHQYYLKIARAGGCPRRKEGSKSMTFASLGGEKGKVFRVFQRVTKATECCCSSTSGENCITPARIGRVDAEDAEQWAIIRNSKMIEACCPHLLLE